MPGPLSQRRVFIEAAAHAALLLQASDMTDANRVWIAQAAPRLHAAARWMLDPANAAPGQAHDAPYTHRFYLDADALGETGLLTGDRALIAASRDYVRRGMARQDAAGFNPAKAGWDTSYHAVGLLFAATYYTLLADDPLRAELRGMADRGLAGWRRGCGPTAPSTRPAIPAPASARNAGRRGTSRR